MQFGKESPVSQYCFLSVCRHLRNLKSLLNRENPENPVFLQNWCNLKNLVPLLLNWHSPKNLDLFLQSLSFPQDCDFLQNSAPLQHGSHLALVLRGRRNYEKLFEPALLNNCEDFVCSIILPHFSVVCVFRLFCKCFQQT